MIRPPRLHGKVTGSRMIFCNLLTDNVSPLLEPLRLIINRMRVFQNKNKIQVTGDIQSMADIFADCFFLQIERRSGWDSAFGRGHDFCHKFRHRFQYRIALSYQHRIAVTEKTISLFDRVLIRLKRKFPPSQGENHR